MTEQNTLPPAPAPFVVPKPGWYDDMPEATYHDDPVEGGSLSSTGARKLIAPGCPAKFKHWRDNREPFKTVFEVGKATHRKTLGVGPELVLFPGTGKNPEAWQKDDDKAAVERMRAEGKIPLKQSQWGMVDAMQRALLEEPMAAALLDPSRGATELSLFWRERTVWGRARLDRLTRLADGRPAIVDYKSVANAAPAKVERSMRDFGWHIQGSFYKRAAQALALVDESCLFLLLCQEKEPPYLATVIEPDPDAMAIGAIRVRQAFEDYAEAMHTGVWAGYADGPVPASLPAYETRELRGDAW